MSLDQISQMATAVSALIAAFSLVSVFYIYQITQRDEKVSRIKVSLIACRSLAKQLDRLLDYEMGFENATIIASSNQIRNLTNKVFVCFWDPDNGINKDVDEYLTENMPSIMAPIQGEFGKEFEEKLYALEKEMSLFEFDFPGAGRVVLAVKNVLRNTYRGQKHLMHNEGAWKAVIKQIINNKKSTIKNASDFELEIIEMFAGTWLKSMQDGNQENIDDAISALDLVVDKYLECSPSKMSSFSKYEQSKTMVPNREIKNVSSGLQEAEKCLDRLLSPEDMRLLRQLSTQIKTRSSHRD